MNRELKEVIIRRLKLKDSWAICFVLGLIMMNSPFISIFNKPSLPFGIPLLYLYLLLGWVAVWFVGPIMQGAGVAALVLLIVGGVLYSVGGVFYALKWPNPWPTTFGHHEFFHACTAVAAICHYIAMWFAVFS